MATSRKRGKNNGSALKRFATTSLARLRNAGWQKPGLGIVLSCGLAFLMADYQRSAGVALGLGEIAERDVQAWTDFKVPNYHLTAEAQRRAETDTSPVFEHDEIVVEELLRRIDQAFGQMHTYFQPEVVEGDAETTEGAAEGEAEASAASEEPPPVDPVDLDKKLHAFEADLGITLTDTDRSTLVDRRFDGLLRNMVMTLVERTMSRMIIDDEGSLPAESSTGISLIRERGAEREEEVLYDFSGMINLQEARQQVAELARQQFADQPPYVQVCAVSIAGSMIRPNLTFNASETRVRREQAKLAVRVVYTEFKENQVIIRKGEKVTQDHVDAVQEMEKHRGGQILWLNLVSLSLLFFLLLTATYVFAARFISKFAVELHELTAMAVLGILAVALCRIGEMLAAALAEAFPAIDETCYYYAIPVAATAVMVRILMNSETAVVFAALVSLACAYVLGGDLFLAIYFFLGSVVGAGALAHAKERGKVFRAGLITSLVNVAFVLLLMVLQLSIWGPEMLDESEIKPLFDVLFAVLAGVGVGIIALGLIPVFEAVGFLTDIKLLELASLDHPLMREMIIKAPGTYHHSVLVGSLGEAAAEAISANALLTRVGAYFHDIGKTTKPHYFVENQPDADNIHDRLQPAMSVLIIGNHVKEGVELGEQHRLPQTIIDMIPQHHGTSLMRFFYSKARESEEAAKSGVSDEDFRYPGPKPQSREAGILMLADGVEAATRSLHEPTRHNISARVQQVINGVVIDGQLDQCPLTLKDLSIVAETFTSVLVGIHHHRVEYPDAKPVFKSGHKPSKESRKPTPPGGGSGKLTLELPPMNSNPDLPHPLDKKARAEAEEALRSSEPGTSRNGPTVANIKEGTAATSPPEEVTEESLDAKRAEPAE